MGSNVRSVTVTLHANVAKYISDMQLAGRATDRAFSTSHSGITTTNDDLAVTTKRLGEVTTETKTTGTALRGLDRDASTTGRQIDRLSGRLRLFADLAASIGPSLIPIGAEAIPLLTSLANEAGFVALATGGMVLAFQGVGDALKAVNKASIQPTAANLEAARIAMAQLSPEAQQLVGDLRDLAPAVRALREAGLGAAFPGLEESLANVETLLPRAERIMQVIGTVTGSLLAEGTASLASDRWAPFFDFLAAEAAPTLEQTAHTVGDLTHGLAELWMAFQPLNQTGGTWIAQAADDFDRWASAVDQTQGFQDFVDYVRTNGPQVADTIGSIGNMFLQVVEAAAPIGGPVLDVLEVVADTISTIADSDLGTPIIAGLALMSTYTRAMSLWGTTSQTSAGQFVAGQRAAVVSLFEVTTAQQRATLSAQELAAAEAKRTAATRTSLVKGAAYAAGLLAITTGLTDSMGLTNTATLTLAGSMAGPWGAAVGAGVGLVMDLGKASGDTAQMIREMTSAVEQSTDAFDFTARNKAIADARSQLDQLRADMNINDQSLISGIGQAIAHPTRSINYVASGLDGSTFIADAEKQLADVQEQAHQTDMVITQLGYTLGDKSIFTTDNGLTRAVADTEELNSIAASAAPALASLGLTWADLWSMGYDDRQIALRQVADFIERADSAAGRTDSFASALADLDNQALSTADSASALSSALDALFTPQLSLSAATDAWTKGLKTLDDELADHNKTLRGNSMAALTNREAIRGRVTDLLAQLKAEAEAGASSQELAATLRQQRRALLDAGEAAGLSKAQLRDYLRELGLTPAVVRTAIEAAGIDKAKAAVRDFRAELASIDRHVDVYINAHTTRLPSTSGLGPQLDGSTRRGGSNTTGQVPDKVAGSPKVSTGGRRSSFTGKTGSSVLDRAATARGTTSTTLDPLAALQAETNNRLSTVAGRVSSLEATIAQAAVIAGQAFGQEINDMFDAAYRGGRP